MASNKKTDNSRLRTKLELRRYYLRKYHSKPPRVFDACQGEGIIWEYLQQEFECQSYWGVDEKPALGRLKINSARVLGPPGWDFDVIDIDTYGSPWKHWIAMLPYILRPVTVFLTIGQITIGGMDPLTLKALGLEFPSLSLGTISPSLAVKIGMAHGLPYHLEKAREHGFVIREASEALPASINGRYIGLHIIPS